MKLLMSEVMVEVDGCLFVGAPQKRVCGVIFLWGWCWRLPFQ
jgi:hypothetical protein